MAQLKAWPKLPTTPLVAGHGPDVAGLVRSKDAGRHVDVINFESQKGVL